jgi:hypothetical protein
MKQMQTSVQLEKGRLGKDAIAQYWEDGYLFPIDAMSREEAVSLRRDLEEIERDWLDNGLPLPLNTYKRVNANCVMPLADRIARNGAILDIVEGILGPNLLAYGVEFFIKEPKTTQIVSMHQDLTYWGLGATSEMVTVWLALSPATPESGCMQFVKGSHKNPILPHEDSDDENNLLSRGQEVRVDVAEEDKVPIEIHPGQISLHHGLTIHGSGPNVSDDRRIAAVVRYVTPNVMQEVAERDYAMLVRGADRVGNFINYTGPSEAFSKESLALYDQIRLAQSQATMNGTTNKKGLYA